MFYEKLDELVYENWAYKHSVIGSMEDLDNATLEDVREFHDIYYRPNNAVLAVVGDIDIKETQEMVEEYFGDIAPGDPPPEVKLSEPPHTAEKRMTWIDNFAPMPAYVCAYLLPERTHPDRYVMEVIEKILLDGESSRLYQRFVEQDQSLVHVYGGVDNKFGPSVFMFFGQVKPGIELKTIEQTLEGELARLQQDGISERELEKAKNQFKTDFIQKLERVAYKADLLCMYTTFFNDPELLYSELERFMNVTAEDIQRVAQTYFTRTNRSVIEVYPKQMS
ncbi:MAG: insulinase family protein [Calditrichaeota bacterium]|nr:MAG: insulinase family protein [Calditrichota bacterium]